MHITFKEISTNQEIRTYISKADDCLNALGYTEHSFAHVGKVASNAEYILKTLGYSEHDIDLAKIAAYLHDIGNVINRVDHSQSGAIMAFRILDRLNMPPEDIATIISAIGNHDEGTGVPVNHISAALIIADKSDVRRSRVRDAKASELDIHDRVNYSVKSSAINIDNDKKTLSLILEIDTSISSVMSYFEIFLDRMLLCIKASEALGLVFALSVNGQQLL